MRRGLGLWVGLATLTAGIATPVFADNAADSRAIALRVAGTYDANWRKMKADEFTPLLAELTNAIRLDEKNLLAFNLRSQVRNYQLTSRHLRRILDGAPMDPEEKSERLLVIADSGAVIKLAKQESAKAADYQRRGESYYEIARRSSQDAADYQRAIADLTAAVGLSQDPKLRSRLMVTRARSHAGLGDLKASLADFKTALDLTPTSQSVLKDRAAMLRSQGEFQQAFADWFRLGRLLKAAAKPDDLGWNSSARLELDTHRRTVGETLKSSPKDALGYTRLGAAQAEAGKLDLAVASLTEALKLEPKQVTALARRASAYMSQRNLDAALKDAEEALALDPTHLTAKYVRGMLAGVKGDLNKMVEDLSDCIQRDPELAGILGAYGNRSKGYRALGKAELAMADDAKQKELSELARSLSESLTEKRFLDGK
ncbi:MAG: tetratricopeptide repeat protein [Actinomycetota bacterium]